MDFESPQKIFAVGDIHGCYEKLKVLLERIPFDPVRDSFVFLGDYINRGADTRDVISFLLEFRRRCPSCTFLLGNHEQALLEYERTGDIECVRILRGMKVEATLASYGSGSMSALRDLSFLDPEHRAFLESLLPYQRVGDYLFVHAGVAPGETVESCSLESLLNIRMPFLRHEGHSSYITIFGHTPFETPLVTPSKIGIDTGAVYGNVLTAVELPRMRFYHS